MTPQQIEALKLALEALETCEWVDDGGNGHAEFDPGKVIAAAMEIKEALAEHAMQEVQRLGQEIEQEPVAIKRMKEWIEYLKRKSDFGQHMKIPSEMSAGTCWELAIELEQFINTSPPQRTWVWLTDEEIGTIAYNVNPLDGIRQFSRAIEAKLKQKNGYAEENT